LWAVGGLGVLKRFGKKQGKNDVTYWRTNKNCKGEQAQGIEKSELGKTPCPANKEKQTGEKTLPKRSGDGSHHICRGGGGGKKKKKKKLSKGV